jgi:hypothetical protein
MTIVEAVVEILKLENKALTAKEITDRILDKSLYQFNSKNIVGMVRGAIHRRCKGYENKNSISPALFEKLENNAYKLID